MIDAYKYELKNGDLVKFTGMILYASIYLLDGVTAGKPTLRRIRITNLADQGKRLIENEKATKTDQHQLIMMEHVPQ